MHRHCLWYYKCPTRSGIFHPTIPFPQVNDLIILTNENACLRYFVKKLVEAQIPMLIVGPTGTGKSSMVLNFLLSLPKEKYITNTVTFSARTTANQVRTIRRDLVTC